MSLDNYTSKQLQDEIAARKEREEIAVRAVLAAIKLPEPRSDPDWSQLVEVIKSVVKEIDEKGYCKSGDHYVFEAAVTCLYEQDIWDWWNKKDIGP